MIKEFFRLICKSVSFLGANSFTPPSTVQSNVWDCHWLPSETSVFDSFITKMMIIVAWESVVVTEHNFCFDVNSSLLSACMSRTPKSLTWCLLWGKWLKETTVLNDLACQGNLLFPESDATRLANVSHTDSCSWSSSFRSLFVSMTVFPWWTWIVNVQSFYVTRLAICIECFILGSLVDLLHMTSWPFQFTRLYGFHVNSCGSPFVRLESTWRRRSNAGLT